MIHPGVRQNYIFPRNHPLVVPFVRQTLQCDGLGTVKNHFARQGPEIEIQKQQPVGTGGNISERRPTSRACCLDLNSGSVRGQTIHSFAVSARKVDPEQIGSYRLTDIAHKIPVERKPQVVSVKPLAQPVPRNNQLCDFFRQPEPHNIAGTT